RRTEIFSRNLERTTDMFPDIAAAARASLRAQRAIIEGEAVAINEATGEFFPFQVVSQRKRKHKIEETAREFPLTLVAFDLLYAEGHDLLAQPYQARRVALEKLIKPAPRSGAGKKAGAAKSNGRIRLVERLLTDDAEDAQRFFDEQIERGMEGVIAKRL